MKDQYVIKLSDHGAVMNSVVMAVDAVRKELSKENAYRMNARSFTLPTTIGVLPDGCITLISLSRMVAEREICIAFRDVLKGLYGDEYASEAKTCCIKRAVSTFIAPNVGSSWLKGEVMPGTEEYKKLFGDGDKECLVEIAAIKRLVMEVEIEEATYYGITQTILVADKAGKMSVFRFGCVAVDEDIERIKKYFDSEMCMNRWEENRRYDEIMSYHGAISPLRERIYYAFALKAQDESTLPTKVSAYLETMNEFLMQLAQRANCNRPTKSGNISLN